MTKTKTASKNTKTAWTTAAPSDVDETSRNSVASKKTESSSGKPGEKGQVVSSEAAPSDGNVSAWKPDHGGTGKRLIHQEKETQSSGKVTAKKREHSDDKKAMEEDTSLPGNVRLLMKHYHQLLYKAMDKTFCPKKDLF